MNITEDQIARAAEALAGQLKAGAPIDYVKHDGGNDYTFDGTLNVADLAEQMLLAAQTPVALPDRDELARELFMKDNSNGRPKHLLNDWIDLSAIGDTYCHHLADAAIAAFKRANR